MFELDSAQICFLYFSTSARTQLLRGGAATQCSFTNLCLEAVECAAIEWARQQSHATPSHITHGISVNSSTGPLPLSSSVYTRFPWRPAIFMTPLPDMINFLAAFPCHVFHYFTKITQTWFCREKSIYN